MEELPQKGILIAFGELFLKSKGVKNLFQKRLVENLYFSLKKEKINFKIHSFRERILTETKQIKRAMKVIGRISGISWFAECFYFPKINLEKFSNFISQNYKNWIKAKDSFAIRLKLKEDILKKNREKIIDRIAKRIERKVNLTIPQKEIFIEIRKNEHSKKLTIVNFLLCSFLYFEKQKGLGGLPLGSSGKVLTLMSGGIDSPVAAYLIAKKGVQNVWLHFHSYPLVSNRSIEKIKELAKIFSNYQPKIKIYFVPFSKAQTEIKLKAPANYRILLYRRLMLKIAEMIAEKEKCGALVTGESLGQVSSQTLPNLKNIEEAVKIPILRPLISMDKEEIIGIAKKINTFDISIKPQEDCCTLFTPKHSTAEGKIETIKELERKIYIKNRVRQIIKEAQIMIE